MITERIGRQVMPGLWALFLISLALSSVLIILNLPRLTILAEDFQVDSYDTILSIMWFGEHGPFQQLPYHPQGYSMFGNFPLLYAFLGSLADSITSDPSLSMSLVYWMAELSIAALLYKRFLAHLDWKIRLLFISLFLTDLAFGNLFPLGYRRRQQLAILLGMLMFLTRRLPLQLGAGFAALLAQPFTGAAVILLKCAHLLDRRRFQEIVLFAIPFLLAYPFYSSLLSSAQSGPDYAGCAYVVQLPLHWMALFVLAAAALFYYSNRRDIGFLEGASMCMFFIYPILILAFPVLKAALPQALDAFLHITSLPCDSTLLNAAALGLVLSIYLKKARVTKAAAASLIILAVLNLNILSFFLHEGEGSTAGIPAFLDLLESENLSKVKTLELLAVSYPDGIRFKPVSTMFFLQGYAILHGREVAFVEEYLLPYHISKGGANIAAAELPSAVFEGDVGRCSALADELGSAGVEGLVYLVKDDGSIAEGLMEERLLDGKTLDGCGLEPVLSDAHQGSATIIYRIG